MVAIACLLKRGESAASKGSRDSVPLKETLPESEKSHSNLASVSLLKQTVPESKKSHTSHPSFSGDVEGLLSKQTSHATEIGVETVNLSTSNCKVRQMNSILPGETTDKFGSIDKFGCDTFVVMPNETVTNLEDDVNHKPEQIDEVIDQEIRSAFEDVSKEVKSAKLSQDKSELSTERAVVVKDEDKSETLEKGKRVIHKCKICGKVCRTLPQLQRHTRNHKEASNNEEKAPGFECDVCKKSLPISLEIKQAQAEA